MMNPPSSLCKGELQADETDVKEFSDKTEEVGFCYARRAVDIHHQYVPAEVIGEARRHGKTLGIEVTEDKDGTLRFSFNGGSSYPLLQGLTDWNRGSR